MTTVACSSSTSSERASEERSDSDETTRTSSGADRIGPAGRGLEIEVTRVSDGDSVRATSAEGDLEIRLLGVNAPERDDCFGDVATERLRELLSDQSVKLHPWPAETDEFGRRLGFLMAGDTFVNLSLIGSGHVIARAQSDHGFEKDFEQAERAASAEAVGLWARDACGVPSDAQLRIVEVEENAPGDDRQNPNGEWVLIENDGDTAVQLEGWGLRDESTRHRFEFPSVQLEPRQSVRVRTGCGNNDLGATPVELFWCDPEPPVWNNDGDTAFLLDLNGAVADSKVVTG